MCIILPINPSSTIHKHGDEVSYVIIKIKDITFYSLTFMAHGVRVIYCPINVHRDRLSIISTGHRPTDHRLRERDDDDEDDDDDGLSFSLLSEEDLVDREVEE